MYKKCLIVPLLIISNTVVVNANNTEDGLIHESLTLFDSVKTILKSQPNKSFDLILNKPCDINWDNESEVKALMAQSEMLDDDLGLEFRAGYTTDNLESETSGEGSTYLELSWDVLRNGYNEMGYKSQDKMRQARIKRIDGEIRKMRMDYNCRNLQILRDFGGIESALLTGKLKLMEKVYSIERRAYLNNEAYLDELLNSEEEIRLTRMNLELLTEDSYWHDDLFETINPPVIDVNLAALVNLIREDNRALEIYKLNQLRLKDEEFDNDRANRLRLFLRKEFDFAQINQDGLVAGLRFQMPLVFDGNKYAQSKEYLINQLEKDFLYEQWELIARTRNAYLGLKDQLERVTKQQYRVLKAAESVRRIKSYSAMDMPLNTSAVVVRVINYLNAAIELIEVKKVLYQRVNQIFMVARVNYTPSVIRRSELNEVTHRSRSSKRSVYIWSDEFNQYSNYQLSLLLETKSISEVLISYGKKTNQAKLMQFIKEHRDELDIGLIAGDNNWLNEDKHDEAISKITRLGLLTNHVHLDIEPQVLSDYKEKKAQYLNQLLALIKKVRMTNPELRLSIAVPFHWDREVYLQLADYVDAMYIMLYGTQDLDKMTERAKRIINEISLDKTIIVLRQEDVQTEYQFENYLSHLAMATGIKHFALHKLSLYETKTE